MFRGECLDDDAADMCGLVVRAELGRAADVAVDATDHVLLCCMGVGLLAVVVWCGGWWG